MNTGGGGALNVYGPDGTRVEKQVGSAKTDYISFGGQVIAEYSNGKWADHIYAGGKRIARLDPLVIDVRFTNDSCSSCNGPAIGGGDRNLFVHTVTIGSVTVLPTDASVTYTSEPCNGAGVLLCNGDFISTNATSIPPASIKVNAFGTSDYDVYPHMQLLVNGVVMGEWDVTGSPQDYTVTVPMPAARYYHADHLGTARLETAANATVVSSCTYSPFGYELNCSPSDLANHYKFTGQERDGDVTSSDMPQGLDHFPFRDYASQLGRWMRPDPAGLAAVDIRNPQSWNRYSYVLNNPLRFTDPFGLWHCAWSDGTADDPAEDGGASFLECSAQDPDSQWVPDEGDNLNPYVIDPLVYEGDPSTKDDGEMGEWGEQLFHGAGMDSFWQANYDVGEYAFVGTGAVLAAPGAVTGGLTAASYVGGRALALYGGMSSSGIAIGYQNMTQAAYELDGLARLKVPDTMYNGLNNLGLWMSLNRGYLDQAISQGSRIFQVSTSTPVYNSWYWWELQYLGQLGWH